MSEKLTKLALGFSENAMSSRRGFLGRAGRGALGLAVGLAGVLAASKDAHAAAETCCCYGGNLILKVPAQSVCPRTFQGRTLKYSSLTVSGRCLCPL